MLQTWNVNMTLFVMQSYWYMPVDVAKMSRYRGSILTSCYWCHCDATQADVADVVSMMQAWNVNMTSAVTRDHADACQLMLPGCQGTNIANWHHTVGVIMMSRRLLSLLCGKHEMSVWCQMSKDHTDTCLLMWQCHHGDACQIHLQDQHWPFVIIHT